MKNSLLPNSAEYCFSPDYSCLIPVNQSLGLPTLIKIPHSQPACYQTEDRNHPLAATNFYSYGSIEKLYQQKYPQDDSHLKRWEEKVGGKQAAKKLINEVIEASKQIEQAISRYDNHQPIQPVSSRYQGYVQALQQILPEFKQPVYLTQGLIVNFQLGVFGIIDRLGGYKNWNSALIDLKASLNPKTNLDWIEDKITQIAAYSLIVSDLYPIDTVGLIFFVKDGSFDEYFFDSDQILDYQEDWLDRLKLVRSWSTINLAA